METGVSLQNNVHARQRGRILVGRTNAARTNGNSDIPQTRPQGTSHKLAKRHGRLFLLGRLVLARRRRAGL